MTHDDLVAYLDGFLGYGNPRAPLWFVGLEEGGGGTVEALERRVDAWTARGRAALEDVAEFHRAIGEVRWFRDGASTQPTWRLLISTSLGVRGRAHAKDDLARHQIDSFARRDGDEACLELMPLPRPKTTVAWPYGRLADAPGLQTASAYQRLWQPRRIHALRAAIARHRPSVVVFYGLTARDAYEEIAGAPKSGLTSTPTSGWSGADYVLLPHPVARARDGWSSKAAFADAVDPIAGRLRRSRP